MERVLTDPQCARSSVSPHSSSADAVHCVCGVKEMEIVHKTVTISSELLQRICVGVCVVVAFYLQLLNVR